VKPPGKNGKFSLFFAAPASSCSYNTTPKRPAQNGLIYGQGARFLLDGIPPGVPDFAGTGGWAKAGCSVPAILFFHKPG